MSENNNSAPIFWKNELVGHINNPKKWPVIWQGKWVPADTQATQDFLGTLGKGVYVWVEVGESEPKAIATIERTPDAEIELLFSEGFDEQRTRPVAFTGSDD